MRTRIRTAQIARDSALPPLRKQARIDRLARGTNRTRLLSRRIAMTKRWSSVRSDLTATKRQASKLERQEAKMELAEFIERDETITPLVCVAPYGPPSHETEMIYCAKCQGYISINLKPKLGRKCACVAVGKSKPTRKRLPDPRIFGLFKPQG
jgi:hypothetical protein